MKKLFSISFLLLIGHFSFLYSQNFYPTIAYLSADSLEGRAPATKSEEKVLNFLTTQLQNICDTVYKQPFNFTYKATTATTNNLIAFQDNHQAKTIIFMAHYDHLGWGNAKSREIIHRNRIHNGADDNASGVAMVIALANFLAKKDTSYTKYNYLFLFPSAHEIGLIGSTYFLTTLDSSNLAIQAILNFDMVGRLDTTYPILKIGGKDTNTTFKQLFKEINQPTMQLNFSNEQLFSSDATPFYKRNIPTLTFTTGIHEDYHKASDDIDKINIEGMKSIFNFITEIIYCLNQFQYPINP